MSGTMLYTNNEIRNSMVLLEKYDNYKKMREVHQWKFLCEFGRAFAITWVFRKGFQEKRLLKLSNKEWKKAK